MFVLFTDFGPAGPYLGQMKSALATAAPDIPVIDLLSDAPAFAPQPCAYLLAALVSDFPAGAIFLGIIDPGVGSTRAPIVLKADDQWFVGPANGLFEIVGRRATDYQAWRITYEPKHQSASFHGRDLFAPVAAMIAKKMPVPGDRLSSDHMRQTDWPDDLPEIVYIDHFGNAMTGMRAATLPENAVLEAAGQHISRARVFSDVETGSMFWYENANGLAEIAVNQGRADERGLKVGIPVSLSTAAEAIR
ncbi:MAG: SAM-dependent chlorinase/fluorinase [Alphaproteobacteria bacterium]|nr:SAM-dependent chlorinase/fluorinase [Alphaproteobacteria bacterium]